MSGSYDRLYPSNVPLDRRPDQHGLLADPGHHLPCVASNGIGVLTSSQASRLLYALTKRPLSGYGWCYSTEIVERGCAGEMGYQLRMWFRLVHGAQYVTALVTDDPRVTAYARENPWWFERDESEWPAVASAPEGVAPHEKQ